jgi:broad specificity phosphatase PhoE
LQGHTDVPLSPEGIHQASLVAKRLSTEPVTAVWSSDLSRAMITAEMIASHHSIPVHSSSLLRETKLGLWEGLTKQEIIDRGDEPILRASRLDPMAYRPPEAELLEHVWDRMIKARDDIMRKYQQGNVVVVGHGGSLRVFLCDALGIDVSGMRRIWLDNVSISQIEYEEGQSVVRSMNDVCHLQK